MRTRHLRRIVLLAAAVTAAAGSGCSTMNGTERGAVGGGVVGTAAGTAIGAATHHPLLGAAVGGLAGATTGALIGNDVDKQDQRNKDVAQAAALADAQAAQQRLGITDVIGLAKAGHNDTIIINQIRTTHSTFVLSAADLDLLKSNGVSDRVIAEMQASQPRAGRVVVREQAPVIYDSGPVYVRPAPVVVVAPRPYGYGYGGGYYYRRW
jgi:hypothetical protein